MDIASGIVLAESLGGYDFIVDVSGTKWAAITCSQSIRLVAVAGVEYQMAGFTC
jgi:hypothetical protein